MGKTKKIINLIGNSHCFSSCDDKQIIYLCDNKYAEFSQNVFPAEIFSQSKINENTLCYSFHIMLRSYDEIILKEFFSWKNVVDKQKNDKFKNFILRDDIKSFHDESRSCRLNLLCRKKYSSRVSFDVHKNIYLQKKN